jgi:hypothetical protein
MGLYYITVLRISSIYYWAIVGEGQGLGWSLSRCCLQEAGADSAASWAGRGPDKVDDTEMPLRTDAGSNPKYKPRS